MIVVYKREDWDIMRVEDAISIAVGEMDKLMTLNKEFINRLIEKKEFETGKLSVAYSESIFRIASRRLEIYLANIIFKEMNYKYMIEVSTKSGEYFTFFTKEKGDENLINKIFSNTKINFIFIDSEKGIIEVE